MLLGNFQEFVIPAKAGVTLLDFSSVGRALRVLLGCVNFAFNLLHCGLPAFGTTTAHFFLVMPGEQLLNEAFVGARPKDFYTAY